MAIDKEQIKKALNSFEDDKFMDAKDVLSKEIKAAKYEFLEKKLGLSEPIEPKPEQKSNGDEDKSNTSEE